MKELKLNEAGVIGFILLVCLVIGIGIGNLFAVYNINNRVRNLELGTMQRAVPTVMPTVMATPSATLAPVNMVPARIVLPTK